MRRDDGLPHTYILKCVPFAPVFLTVEWSTSCLREARFAMAKVGLIRSQTAASLRGRTRGPTSTTQCPFCWDVSCRYTLETAGLDGFLTILPYYISVVSFPFPTPSTSWRPR